MKVCVVGIGRMGLAVATRFAVAGAQVTGVDVNEALVSAVNDGSVAVDDEPELSAHLTAVRADGRLRATTDTTAAVREADAILVLVRMVADADGHPDYANLDAATAAIGAGLRRGALVVYETTVPVGDTRGRFAPALGVVAGLTAGRDFHVCFSPERVSSGSIFRDLAAYPKLVGGLTDACTQAGVALYREHLDAEVWRMPSAEAAEFAKIAETTYRDVNIALANEFAQFADSVGVDFLEVARAANSQPYSHIHQPGIGVGGHCIPVYPHFFMARASEARLVRLARTINDGMPAYAVDRLGALLGGLDKRRVLILGLAFRGNVAEASHSVAFALHAELVRRGARVRVHDPVLGREAVERLGFEWDDLMSGWAEGAVLQAAHDAYRQIDPQTAVGLRALVDGRGVLDGGAWRRVGVAFAGIGR